MRDVIKSGVVKPWITRNIALVAHDNQKAELLDLLQLIDPSDANAKELKNEFDDIVQENKLKNEKEK